MMTKDQNTALLIVGNEAQKNPDWKDYALYCLNREKGLRKEAFQCLGKFLKATEDWTTERKIDFAKFLFPFLETVKDADYGPFPHPLKEGLLKPILELWCSIEPRDGRAFRWYGKYYRSEDSLLTALEIDSQDDFARQTIISWWMDRIYYSIHHLPQGYIGEPTDDLKLGEEIHAQISRLTKPETADHWRRELEEDLELVRNYIEWEKSGHPDLEVWGTENRKNVSYKLTRVYYYTK